MLKVSKQSDGRPEIFYSVQGEGVNSGRPAVFLRLALCNLKCEWCDTRYTWESPGEQILILSPEIVRNNIPPFPCRYLVITGGEPLLQQQEILPVIEPLKNEGFYIEIETNGTIVPTPELLKLVDHWSVSPKLDNSKNPPSSREVPECYLFFASQSNSHFKFVVQSRDDLSEVQGLVKKYNLAPGKIILMPEAQDTEMLLERSRWLVESCKAHGFLFSIRLQVLLWGRSRGK